MSKIYEFGLLGFCLIFFACRLPMAPVKNTDHQIYFNSFESAADTVGWQGHGSIFLDDRAAPGGGKCSLKVSGGCIIPHARYYLGKMEQDGYLTLNFWGRNLELGGAVSLEVYGDSVIEKVVSVSDTLWKFYSLADPVYTNQNSDVYISVNSGGIVYSAVLIDVLRVNFESL